MKLGLTFPEKLTGTLSAVRQEFEQLTAAVQSGWSTEHKADGSHGDITADNLSVPTMTCPEPKTSTAGLTGLGATNDAPAARTAGILITADVLIDFFHKLYVGGNAQIGGNLVGTSGQFTALETTNGGLTMTADAAPGIAFPATQVAGLNNNTLDDYEKGTWTPTLTFATAGDLNVVYSVRIGNYQKIGNWVRCMFVAAVSTWTHTTAAGNLHITGLPYTSKTETNSAHVGALSASGVNFTAGYTMVVTYLISNDTKLLVVESGDNVGNQAQTVTNYPTGVAFGLTGQIEYQAAL